MDAGCDSGMAPLLPHRAGASIRAECEHVFVSYVELHSHSAFSFLDGASLPDELVGAAVELGYDALALTDHNSLSGSMEFAQAAGALGLKAIHGAEVDLEDGRHLTLLVEDATGWRNLCRIVTRAHAHDRDHGEPPPAVPLETIEEHAEGLVCLSGCARHGVRDEPTLRRLLAAFGRDRLRVELQRPFQRHDRALNRELAALAAAARGAVRGDGQRPRARALARAAAGRLRGPARPHDAGRLRARCAAATSRTCWPRRRRWPRASRTTRPRWRRRARWPSACASTSGPTSATATPARRTRARCAGWPSCAGARLDDRYPAGRRGARTRRARLEEELRVIDALGLAGLLPAAPRPARARARGGGRGPRAGHGARAAAAGPRPRLLGVLDRLLPHRPLAHRPDRERALPRALPQRGAAPRCRTSTSTSRATSARC